MNNKLGMVVASLALFTMVSSAVFGYVLLNPARRWFNADTPRLVHVDSTGLASVVPPHPDHGVTAAKNAVTAWNSGGVNPTASTAGSVAYVLGDGISDLKFGDPLHICTGSCIAATTTGYYDTSKTGTCTSSSGSLTVVKITDSDVAFNLSYNYTTVAQGSCSSEI